MGVQSTLFYVTAYISLFTSMFFLYTFWDNYSSSMKRAPPAKIPKVTVVVPAFNEQECIAATIESLLKLNYPKEKLEIIVVDDGSTDKTYEIAKKYDGGNVRVFTKKNGGKGSALNFAIKKSKGEFVGALDADSFVHPDALINMVGYFEDPNIMAVTPALKVYNKNSILPKIQVVEYLMGVFLRKVFAMLGSIHVTPGPFTIYRKFFFKQYGGYDEKNITEDIEIALRIQSKNYQIENAMDACVYTMSPTGFRELLWQRVRWYLGFIDNVLNHKNLFGFKHGILGVLVLPMAFFSVALAVGAFFFTSVLFAINLRDQISGLSAINYDVIPLIKAYFEHFHLNFIFTSNMFFLIVLLGLSVVMLYLAIKKSFETGNKHLIISYGIYMFLYWILFSIWWIAALGYKVCGKQLKFGGVAWDNSLLSKCRRNNNGRQESNQ